MPHLLHRPRFFARSLCFTVAAALACPAPLLAQGTYVGSAAVVTQGAALPPSYAQPSYGVQTSFSQDELDALLAPIALYPDELLAQILMAATFPQDVADAARFVRQNPGLRGAALDNALADRNWDPSVLSLAAFPQVLDMMTQRPDWTRRVGEAFYANQDGVMQTVQDLRARAYTAGNLVDTPQQQVIYQDRTIIIEPARPDVVYIPTYNPLVVYGPWWAPAYQPYYWRPSRVYYPGIAIGAGLVGFGLAYSIGGNHWGWARPDWRQRGIAIDGGRNRFIDRRPYYRDWVREGHWQHRPDQWRGQGGGYARPRENFHGPVANVNRPGFVGRDYQGAPARTYQDRGRGEARAFARGEGQGVAPSNVPESRPNRERMRPAAAQGDNPGLGAPRAAPQRRETAPAARAEGARPEGGARGGERGADRHSRPIGE